MLISKRAQKVSPSQTLKITSEIKKMKKDNKPVINFAAGEPDFDTPEKIKEAAYEAIKGGFTKYTPVSGTHELRESISAKFKKSNNLDYSSNQIIVSNGAKQALFNALLVILNPGDEVIIMAPYWLSYTEMVKLADGVPVIIDADKENGFRPKFDDIEKKITSQTKCIILNTPTNPTGMVWSKSELEQLSEIVLKHKILVISDEIYEHLIYEDSHISIGALSKDILSRTITVNGVSKSFSMTGWRIGWMGAPYDIAQEVSKIQGQMTSNPCSISQMAAVAALGMDGEWFDYLRNEFKKRRDFMISKLKKLNISFVKPEGAFYLFMDIDCTGLDSFAFAEKLLSEKLIGVIPGVPFGRDDFVRLSYATSINEIEEGIMRIGAFLSV
ncbi:MAG: pyridoxal phosphate-dependent aminotransferase [Candidatus Saelkia tenebricola]|nr:pyridoxal phosphate-dependent aminotransferase [Candidatus Saelkia tenebricola]